MAGLGLRVKDLKIDQPKPLIKISGKPLFQHSLDSLLSFANVRHKVATVSDEINELEGFALIRPEHQTNGPLESALLAVQELQGDLPFAVLDCDLSFTINTLVRFGAADAIIMTFASDKPRYSYAQIANASVTRVAEKKVISTSAIAGCYLFKSKSTFLNLGQQLLSNNALASELYISDLLSVYLKHELRIKAIATNEYCSLGTTQEILSSGFSIDSK
tara:strand:- start:7855 stop:8508 length:654 start_codon:yes stop_codon:yes gene_type:complete